uniref:Uncharacterized protein n=1 Tax=Psilocybe cubensis TaxID=181762 RepID=A0A8H8CPX6_PSICU
MDKDTTLRSPNGQMYRNQDAVDYSTDVEATKEESNHFGALNIKVVTEVDSDNHPGN